MEKSTEAFDCFDTAKSKLARRYRKLNVCYEAGPTAYGLYRHIEAWGTVVAQSLIPKKRGIASRQIGDPVTLARFASRRRTDLGVDAGCDP